MKKRKAPKRPNRNEIATRVTLREGGRIQVNRAQVKDVIAAYWDEAWSLPVDEATALVYAEIVAAQKRYSRRNLS